MNPGKLYPAIKQYVEAVEELTGRTYLTFEFGMSAANLATELIIYFLDLGKPLQILLPDNKEEIEWKTQRLLVTARNAVVGDRITIGNSRHIYCRFGDAGLCTVPTVTAQPEPSWVELETMKGLV